MKDNEIDVKNCVYYDKDCFWHCGDPTTESYKCKENDNCYFKQIAELKQQLKPFQDPYFNGLTTQDIAELAKKSLRPAKDNCELRERVEELENKLA